MLLYICWYILKAMKYLFLLLGFCFSLSEQDRLQKPHEILKKYLNEFCWGLVSSEIGGYKYELKPTDSIEAYIWFSTYACRQSTSCTLYVERHEQVHDIISGEVAWFSVSCQPVYLLHNYYNNSFEFTSVSEAGTGQVFLNFVSDTLIISGFINGYENSKEKYVAIKEEATE